MRGDVSKSHNRTRRGINKPNTCTCKVRVTFAYKNLARVASRDDQPALELEARNHTSFVAQLLLQTNNYSTSALAVLRAEVVALMRQAIAIATDEDDCNSQTMK